MLVGDFLTMEPTLMQCTVYCVLPCRERRPRGTDESCLEEGALEVQCMGTRWSGEVLD